MDQQNNDRTTSSNMCSKDRFQLIPSGSIFIIINHPIHALQALAYIQHLRSHSFCIFPEESTQDTIRQGRLVHIHIC